jgi:glutamate-1-semialdehyde aminotransferase
VEAAIKLARHHTERPYVLAFFGAFHGRSYGSVSLTASKSTYRAHFGPLLPGVLHAPFGDEDPDLRFVTEHLFTRLVKPEELAAVVVEPVPSRHPDRQPVEFVRALRELCDRHGIVLMFDEMLTGFRPHPQGAQGVFGVRADLATYGKVIGHGYPIGAIAGRADIMDRVDGGFWQYGDDSGPRGDTIFFAGTYIHHPVSMVAARAVLTRLRDQGPGLQQQLNARTDRFAGTLNDFLSAEEFPVRVQHFGSLFRLAHQGDLELLFKHMILEGVHVWDRRNLFLSTAHTDADVDFVIDAIRNSLSDLRRGGFLTGGAVDATKPDFSR